MKVHDWVWLRDSLRLRWSWDTLDVFQDNEERLMLDSARGFTLDLRSRVALRDGRVLASFDEIENFAIEGHDSDVGDRYRLFLARVGKCDILIGETSRELDCSRLAARMSTLTGKSVVARQWLS
jgi:hypothetical protein